MLGCLFILLFGGILFAVGLLKMLFQLFSGNMFRTARPESQRQGPRAQRPSGGGTTAGNARHEGQRANSRKRRSEKIFRRDEGRYVDFEEI